MVSVLSEGLRPSVNMQWDLSEVLLLTQMIAHIVDFSYCCLRTHCMRPYIVDTRPYILDARPYILDARPYI